LWKKTSLRTAPNNQPVNGFATSASFNKVHEKRKLLMGKQDSVGPVTANTEALIPQAHNTFTNMNIDRAKETFNSLNTNA
jgi:hypothetical protein